MDLGKRIFVTLFLVCLMCFYGDFKTAEAETTEHIHEFVDYACECGVKQVAVVTAEDMEAETFTSLSDAFDAAEGLPKATITMVNDDATAGYYELNYCDILLDLNGKRIYFRYFALGVEAKLTITDNSDLGTGVLETEGSVASFSINNDSSLIFEKGKFLINAVYPNDAAMVLVNGGYFEGPQFLSGPGGNKITINNGEFYNVDICENFDVDNPEYYGTIEVKGGKFYESIFSPNFKSILVDGYAIIDDSSEFIDLNLRYATYFEIIEHTHEYGWIYSEEGHYLACQCGYIEGEKEVIPHSGGSANCSELALCETCNSAYGDFDNSIHLEEKALVEMQTATCTNIGYDAHYKCACGSIFNLEGTEISLEDITTEAIGHSFNDQLICGTCGELAPYYAVTADGKYFFNNVTEFTSFMNGDLTGEVKVVLNQDINLDNYICVYLRNDLEFTYDLNGHLSNNIYFQVYDDKVTFKLVDSSVEKTGLLKTTKIAHPIYCHYGTTIIEASIYGWLYVNSTVIVNGGTFSSLSDGIMVLDADSKVTINGGIFNTKHFVISNEGYSLKIYNAELVNGVTIENGVLKDILKNGCVSIKNVNGEEIVLTEEQTKIDERVVVTALEHTVDMLVMTGDSNSHWFECSSCGYAKDHTLILAE